MTPSVADRATRIQPRTDTPVRSARLSGPSRRLDARVNAVRPDLVDIALAGTVIAPRFAAGVAMSCGPSVAMLHAAPGDDAMATSALLPGENFIVFDLAHGWAWGQCVHDAYVGWVRATALCPAVTTTHRVTVATTVVFTAPDIKAGVAATLPLNARITVSEDDASGDFVTALGGYIHRRHISPLATTSNDPARLALGFVGSPYVWGGRTRDGIDCSGLIQAVLIASGIKCPRDSDQQANAFPAIGNGDRRRGDLIVFPGHIGILADAETMIHANAYWMATVVEPLADAAKRLTPTGFHRPS